MRLIGSTQKCEVYKIFTKFMLVDFYVSDKKYRGIIVREQGCFGLASLASVYTVGDIIKAMVMHVEPDHNVVGKSRITMSVVALALNKKLNEAGVIKTDIYMEVEKYLDQGILLSSDLIDPPFQAFMHFSKFLSLPKYFPEQFAIGVSVHVFLDRYSTKSLGYECRLSGAFKSMRSAEAIDVVVVSITSGYSNKYKSLQWSCKAVCGEQVFRVDMDSVVDPSSIAIGSVLKVHVLFRLSTADKEMYAVPVASPCEVVVGSKHVCRVVKAMPYGGFVAFSGLPGLLYVEKGAREDLARIHQHSVDGSLLSAVVAGSDDRGYFLKLEGSL